MWRASNWARRTYDSASAVNGQPAIGIAVFLQSGANALDVGDAIKARMAELKRDRFPADVDFFVPYDTTRFVSASIKEVVTTILEAALIVVVVVFVFLQSWRATLIPMLAVPVSLIGTFAGLWLMGFSINTLTLFAMVLAIGIVVDDAIVVLENVERLMREEHMEPMAASIEAMREVSGAVVGIVLVLCAVFIPVAFMGGLAGTLYRQFAVTVAIAVVISGVVALTLTPALCALLLKHEHSAVSVKVFGPFNRGFDWLTRRYVGAVGVGLRHRVATLLAFVALLGLGSVAVHARAGQLRAARRPGLCAGRGRAARRRHAGTHQPHHRAAAPDAQGQPGHRELLRHRRLRHHRWRLEVELGHHLHAHETLGPAHADLGAAGRAK